VQNTLYYWGNYSNSLYNFKKNPDESTKKSHIESLEKIINKSNYHGKKIPPGVYCEYGYYFLLEENYLEAKKYFELEKKLYPESTKFVDILLDDIATIKEKNR
jgi:hypothetical protein